MNFLERIFDRLERCGDQPVIQEVRDGRLVPTSAAGLLAMARAARGFLVQHGLKKGDRCALLAPNSARWAALDLALMAEGIIVVPLYSRQAPRELVGMMKDCSPAILCCGDAALRDAIRECSQQAPASYLFDEIFAGEPSAATRPAPRAPEDPVTIIYTSGTSGEPKGVVLNTGNMDHMLPCTMEKLDLLMGRRSEPEQIFHYLPFNFAASWILLLNALSRNSVLTLSTDLTKLADELKLAAPHYFLNVPALLERVRTGVEENIRKTGGFAQRLYEDGESAWNDRREGNATLSQRARLALANVVVFRAIRKKIGANLKALICGSAPLARETQLFFAMLGIRVLQAYGLTETTGICTLDHPDGAVPGRVGRAVPGIAMRLGEGDEIIVRGPNIFPGYWNRPEETANVLREGWFHTGDQGEVDEHGNWRIIGRLKNLLVLNSGHKVAPEPLEENLLKSIPGAQQVVLAGNGRSFLAAIVTGNVESAAVSEALKTLNDQLPHYKKIHAFHIEREPFSIENGLLTANGKLKRDAINAWLQPAIDALYHKKNVGAANER